jgi:hypothetical protein
MKSNFLDYLKKIEICDNETDEGDTEDTDEIVVTLSDGKNIALNTNKNFQQRDVSTDLKKIPTKDMKAKADFPCQIISNVNSTLFNDMISKKKECFKKAVNQDDLNIIEFV